MDQLMLDDEHMETQSVEAKLETFWSLLCDDESSALAPADEDGRVRLVLPVLVSPSRSKASEDSGSDARDLPTAIAI